MLAEKSSKVSARKAITGFFSGARSVVCAVVCIGTTIVSSGDSYGYPSSDVALFASALDTPAPEAIHGVALSMLYMSLISGRPDLTMTVENELLREDRLDSLARLAKSDGEIGDVAVTLLRTLHERSVGREASKISLQLHDDRWGATVALEGEGVNWFELTPPSSVSEYVLSFSALACSPSFSIFTEVDVDGVRYGEIVAHADAEELIRWSAEESSVLRLRVLDSQACEDASLQIWEAAARLPDVLVQPGVYSVDLSESLESTTILRVEAGVNYRLETQRIGSVDTVVAIFSPEGGIIVEDDDGGREFLSSLVNWTAPASGELRLMVSRLGESGGIIEVEFSISRAELNAVRLAGWDETPPQFAVGRRATANVGPDDEGRFAFRGEPGCVYRVDVKGGAVTSATAPWSYLEGSDPEGGNEDVSAALVAAVDTDQIEVGVREEFGLFSCAAEEPWCNVASGVEIGIFQEVEEQACAVRRIPDLPSGVVLADDEDVAWLEIPRAEMSALRLEGLFDAHLRAWCISPSECRVTVSSVDGSGRVEGGSLVYYTFPETGLYKIELMAESDSADLWISRESAYDRFLLGDCVVLGEHDLFGGDRNWHPEMANWVGSQTIITDLAGSDPSGAWLVRVAADAGRWLWRTRNLRIGSGCFSGSQR